jgi:hypothetical protein
MRLAISLAGLAALALLAPPASASTGWTQPNSIANEAAQYPDVAVNGSGRAVAVWYRLQPISEDEDLHTMRYAKRTPGKGFGQPRTIGPADQPGGQNPPSKPHVAIDRDGNAIAVWLMQDGDGNLRVMEAFQPRGEQFGQPEALSEPGEPAFDPEVAFNRRGKAIAVWERFDGTRTRVQAASRPAHQDDFNAPVTLSAPQLASTLPQIGLGNDGSATVVWQARGGGALSNHFIQAARQPAGGGFGEPATISDDDSRDDDVPTLAVAPDGSAVAAWRQGDPDGDLRAQIGTSTAPAGGGDFRPVEAIPGQTDLDPFIPCVGMDREGAATLIWSESPPEDLPGTHVIRSAVANAGGSFGNFQELQRSDDPLLRTALSVSRSGAAAALWVDSPLPMDPQPPSPLSASVRTGSRNAFGDFESLSPAGISAGFTAVGTNRKVAVGVWEHDVSDQTSGIDAAVYHGLAR